KVAEYLQITQLLKQFPSRLSGGEKQRVALGRALLANPQILLCDEPFSNLDQKLKIQIRELFIKTVQAEGITLIFVSHDAEDLQEMNRVIQMDKIVMQ
ncbi:MAG TPA: ATP-binding cassette domain-containing protein, partial [Bacillota bacterium]|nr:ATP-binding cassette domain-containing protein [Bacillota bacterium]